MKIDVDLCLNVDYVSIYAMYRLCQHGMIHTGYRTMVSDVVYACYVIILCMRACMRVVSQFYACHVYMP